jgi:probable HAF family extracellular repeat protein
MRLLTFVRKPARRPRPPWSRPQLEQLEDRWCPASYSVTDLGTLFGGSSVANDINAAGQVVGASDSHAFLWQSGAMTDLGSLFPGGGSVAVGINASGWIVGSAESETVEHAFRWAPSSSNGTSGIMTDLDPLGTWSEALDINNVGKIVGDLVTTGGDTHAFVYENGSMTDLNLPEYTAAGWYLKTARGINDNGQIVGQGVLNGQFLPFLLTDDDGTFSNGGGTITPLATLGSGSSMAWAVNGSGQVAGASAVANMGAATHAFFWEGGVKTDLGTIFPVGTSEAHGINRYGQVVGGSTFQRDPRGNWVYHLLPHHAFSWQKGQSGLTDLNRQISNSSGWTLQEARGINDAGWIVGVGGHNSQQRAFLLKPAGAALTAASAAPNPVRQVLTPAAVRPLLAEAVARWAAAGANMSALRGVSVLIADLPGAELGEAGGQTVSLDTNAAGWGWFIDPTPRSDAEFTTPGNQGEQNRMDLLTVLEHELGHVLGYEHSATGVMIGTLPPGTRRTPIAAVRELAGGTWAWLVTELETPGHKR